jgi:hypothetical protein
MHRAIAVWLTERPWRAAFAGVVCGVLWQMLLPFSMVLAGAIPVLVALRFDGTRALTVALLGAIAASGVSLAAPAPQGIAVGIMVLFFGPVLLALLLKRTGSLNLSFQVAVLGAAIAIVIVHLVVADPVAVWVQPLRGLLDSMTAAGLKLEGDQDALVLVWARTMWGALAALVLATVLGSLFLGRWWLSLLQAPGAFGAEYRRLRLGLVLGVSVTLLFLAAFWSDSTLLASLAWVAFASFSFQGLAAAHRSKAQGRINRGWLAAVYVLLIVPLSMSVTVFILAIWGFVDNWLRPRVPAA